MSNVVIIGAGQTGRGYLNRFFQSESITFLDKDEELICMLVALGQSVRTDPFTADRTVLSCIFWTW